jgi:hypothetical protein
MSNSFKKGMAVTAIDDDFKGIIVSELDNNYFEVEDETGFGFTYHATQIILDANFLQENITREVKLESAKPKKQPKKQKHAIDSIQENRKTWKEFILKKEVYVEIDLHIHNLIASYGHLSSGQMKDMQINAFKRCLDYVLENRIKNFIVIHGQGQGVLKEEIWMIIKEEFGYMSIFEANYQKYGLGASQIEIHYNRRR